MTLLPFEEARARILAAVRPLGAETVAIGAAAGRVLAAPAVARLTQPPFDASAMDGYAVRAGDVAPGAVLRLVGTAQAGAPFAGTVGTGECARIFTGAAVPEGADAVVIQEVASVDGDAARFDDMPVPGQNIRKRGQDFADKSSLVDSGTALTPARIALAAAANIAEVAVHLRPSVALLATGDELVPPGGALGPGRIVGSNSAALAALVAPLAGRVADHGIAPDDEAALGAALAGALDGGADVLVTTGGASVGDHDLVLPALQRLGVEIDFWRIAMRPGRPLMFGTRGDTLVFGLPGNPVSAFVTATMLVLPALRALAGDARPVPPALHLPLAAPLPANGPRRHFWRARLETAHGTTLVRPLTQVDSAHLTTLAAADCLVMQPEDDPGMAAGAMAETMLF